MCNRLTTFLSNCPEIVNLEYIQYMYIVQSSGSRQPSHTLIMLTVMYVFILLQSVFCVQSSISLDRISIYTVKKGYSVSRPQPGCHLPNSPWRGII
jgi:hypothetical protein